MKYLLVLLFLICAGPVVAQPVTITFTAGSEFGTEMDSLTAEYLITIHGPYHYRKIKKMDFLAILPDSATIQKLQSKDIEVYLKTRLVGVIVLKPIVKATVARASESTKVLITSTSIPGVPVTIGFMVGSEIRTEMTGYDDGNVTTEHGPYSYLDIKKMTFTTVLPDSAIILRLQSKNIDVYFKTKRIAPIVQKPILQKSVVVTSDTAKSSTSYPDRYPTSRSSAPVVTVPPISPDLLYTATVGTALGIGLDYGGIGMKLTFNPTDAVSFFGGLGYNFAGLGYNGGLEFNFAPHTKVTGFLSAMYGYNAVLLSASGSLSQSEVFYGPSFGLGVRSWSFNGDNYFSFQLIYPVRDAVFMNANTTEKPWPVLFSIGYGFGR